MGPPWRPFPDEWICRCMSVCPSGSPCAPELQVVLHAFMHSASLRGEFPPILCHPFCTWQAQAAQAGSMSMGHCLCDAMLVAWWLNTLDVLGRVLVRVSKVPCGAEALSDLMITVTGKCTGRLRYFGPSTIAATTVARSTTVSRSFTKWRLSSFVGNYLVSCGRHD